ncbi:MAG: response regulator [Paludisphaera borealis]|uniref:response regulator n=1 Tax=Paludisphaera borealis TaxID=1387353 RepID=UPI00284FEAC1|nr:response regulator [Paludisphaera borealis]MDR3620461.1 response regulator [Paludisphaera borealis]
MQLHEATTHRAARASRVLVVDDERNIRLVFRTALESIGLHIEEAADGAAALERLEHSSFHVVLLDLQMPGVGGMDVLRRIREKGDDTPVVVVTAHGTIPDAVAAMKLGAVDFVQKPVTPVVLKAVVSDVIDRHALDASRPAPDARREAQPVVITLGPLAVDLAPVKLALNRRDFDLASTLLDRVLDIAPESVEALNLMGVLLESRGQDHAAYYAYKKALAADPHYRPACDNMRRYCLRFGLDADSPQINPAVGREDRPGPSPS